MQIKTQTTQTPMGEETVTVRSYITNDHYAAGEKLARRRLRILEHYAIVPNLAHAHALAEKILAPHVWETPDLAHPWSQSDEQDGWLPLYQWRSAGWTCDKYPKPGEYNLVIEQRRADRDWAVIVQLAQVPGSPRKVTPVQIKIEYLAAREAYKGMQAQWLIKSAYIGEKLGLEPDDISEQDTKAWSEIHMQTENELGDDNVKAEFIAAQTALVEWGKAIVDRMSGPAKWEEVAPLYQDLLWKPWATKHEAEAIDLLMRLEEPKDNLRIETWHNASPAMFRPMTGHPDAMSLGYSGPCMVASEWYLVPAHVTGSVDQFWINGSATQEEWAGPNPTLPALIDYTTLHQQRMQVR